MDKLAAGVLGTGKRVEFSLALLDQEEEILLIDLRRLKMHRIERETLLKHEQEGKNRPAVIRALGGDYAAMG